MSSVNGDRGDRMKLAAKKFLLTVYSRKKTILFVLVSFFALGVRWDALPATFPLMMAITPYVLFLFGFFVFASALPEGGARLVFWACVTFTVTFAVEAAGVATGKVFGDYSYGDVLGLKVFGVPLLIGFNWTVVVLGIASAVTRFVNHRPFAVLIIAAGGVFFDWVMEPVATGLGYWSWGGGIIPFQNYLAWFAVGLAAATGYVLSNIRLRAVYPPFYVLIQLAFFAAMYFVVL